MHYLSCLSVLPDRQHPFPYDIPAVRYAKEISFTSPITFFIGDNGTGKSTLLETIAYQLKLPLMGGNGYSGSSFTAAKKLGPFTKLQWSIKLTNGFFFRAEDFGNYSNSASNASAGHYLNSMIGEVPDQVIDQMINSSNSSLNSMRKNYGQDLQSFSHGEAYLHIMQQKINDRGIYLLDEPEAALSPSRQLALIYFIQQHLQAFRSQFIIATHAPILMAYPNACIYEINEHGMNKTNLEDTEHYSITKSFLNNPEAYLRNLDF